MNMSLDKYHFHQCIGKGNFGDVYKATCKTDNTIVAVKAINLDETNEDIKVLIQEIQFLSRLKSPYITRYFETFVDDMSMFIVMEYCGGGSCADLLKFYKKLPEDLVAYIIRDVLKGLNYLHQEKKVHRDIKSANILLTEKGEIKLADFGVSGEITLTQVKRNTFVGTPFWMAPEVITRRKSGGYNEKADIWSTGITTIELVTGSPPLAQYDPMKILFEIPKNKPPLLTGVDFSENIKDFVRYCLLKDPKKRPSSSKLLHHRFISSAKSNIDLRKVIVQKNQWFQLHNKATKKPRHNIFSQQKEKNNIQWDFNTFRTFHSSKMQQTLVNLYNQVSPYLDQDNEGLPGDQGPVRNEPSPSIVTQLHSPLSSPVQQLQSMESKGINGGVEANKKVNIISNLPTPIKSGVSAPCSPHALSPSSGTALIPGSPSHPSPDGNSRSPQSPTTEAVLSDSSPTQVSPYLYRDSVSKGEILFYCLEQVYIRGRNESTKKTVHNLINNLLEFEMEQPGLSEAIVEEIFQFRPGL